MENAATVKWLVSGTSNEIFNATCLTYVNGHRPSTSTASASEQYAISILVPFPSYLLKKKDTFMPSRFPVPRFVRPCQERKQKLCTPIHFRRDVYAVPCARSLAGSRRARECILLTLCIGVVENCTKPEQDWDAKPRIIEAAENAKRFHPALQREEHNF